MTGPNPLSLDFLRHQAGAAADVIQGLAPVDAAAYLTDVPTRVLAPVVEEMETWPAARVLELMAEEQAASLLQALPYRETAALLRLQSPARRDALLADLPTRLATNLSRTLTYPEETVGAWMDMSSPFFRRSLTAAECLAQLGRETNPFGSTVVVLDHDQVLFGVVELDALLVADGQRTLGELADTDLVGVSANMSLAAAQNHAAWRRHARIPVYGSRNAHLGTLSRAALEAGLSRHAKSAPPALHPTLVGHLARAITVTFLGLLQLSGQTKGGERER